MDLDVNVPPLHRPDVCLLPSSSPDSRTYPLVIAEVEVGHRSVPALIRLARMYLANRAMQRVIGILFFRPRVQARENHQWRFAALAVAFDQDPATSGMRVIRETSFGNAPMSSNVKRSLSAVATAAEPAGRLVRLAASPFEDVAIPIDQAFDAALQTQHQGAAVFTVSVPNYPDLQIDLRTMLVNAAKGFDVTNSNT